MPFIKNISDREIRVRALGTKIDLPAGEIIEVTIDEVQIAEIYPKMFEIVEKIEKNAEENAENASDGSNSSDNQSDDTDIGKNKTTAKKTTKKEEKLAEEK